jgi:hypothetical protein
LLKPLEHTSGSLITLEMFSATLEEMCRGNTGVTLETAGRDDPDDKAEMPGA